MAKSEWLSTIRQLGEEGFRLPEGFSGFVRSRAGRFPGDLSELISLFVLECYTDEALSDHPTSPSEKEALRLLDRVVKRASRERKPAPLESDPEAPRKQEIRDLWDAIVSCLEPQEAALIDQYFIQGETLETIASDLGVSVSTVSRRLAEARRKLRKGLGAWD